jgi:L-threonylcarbamoyladenylate synthase
MAPASENRCVETLRLIVDPAALDSNPAQEAIAHAARILRSGGLVALPTETVYGLGANALDRGAVERIFAAKNRPSWDPVIVHIAGPVDDNPMLAQLVTDVPNAARKLIDAFWPGPLTLLLPRSAAVPDVVTAGRPLVGVRMPAHPVALELIRQAGVPVAAPSANLFGHISPTTAEHVLHDLDGRIDAILDTGPSAHGVESTVLDPCQVPAVIYRPGAVTADQIREIVGAVALFRPPNSASQPAESLPAPGTGVRHYAPRAQLVLVESTPEELPRWLTITVAEQAGSRVGVMLPSGWNLRVPVAAVFEWGSWQSPEELAARLYMGLRALDAEQCDVIICPVPSAEGIGSAIRDRLHKAALAR